VKIIVGLGNPGRKYDGTRHNVGWWALDHLADVWRFAPWRQEGDALVADGLIGDARVRLIKPQTFMNLSGVALRPYLRRLEFSGLHHLLVLVDEVAIPIGTLRLRAAGSAGGHNGLKSIESTLGTRDYARLRIGIAPADGTPAAGRPGRLRPRPLLGRRAGSDHGATPEDRDGRGVLGVGRDREGDEPGECEGRVASGGRRLEDGKTGRREDE
jgi:PTH1 family peptidyl-tRNA hydrolase